MNAQLQGNPPTISRNTLKKKKSIVFRIGHGSQTLQEWHTSPAAFCPPSGWGRRHRLHEAGSMTECKENTHILLRLWGGDYVTAEGQMDSCPSTPASPIICPSPKQHHLEAARCHPPVPFASPEVRNPRCVVWGGAKTILIFLPE